jgi:hypothetical protein
VTRRARLVPYALLTVLVALVFAVILTAPFSVPRQAVRQPSSVVAPRNSPGNDLTGLKRRTGKAGPDPHELVAQRAAVQLLAEVPAPPGAVPSRSVPAGTPDMYEPPQMTGATQVVDDHRLWIVPGTTAEVLSWLGSNAVPGSALVGNGTEGTYDAQQLVYDVFDLSSPPGGVILSRELLIGVAQDPAGSVVVRVDIQVVWEPTRPLDSFVPTTATRVVVTDTPQMGSSGKIGSPRIRISSDPAVAHHFLAIVNALPEGLDARISCPAWSGDQYSLVFQSGTGKALATVIRNVDACFGISIQVTGTATIQLSDPNGSLINALESFLPPSDSGSGAAHPTSAP